MSKKTPSRPSSPRPNRSPSKNPSRDYGSNVVPSNPTPPPPPKRSGQ